MLAKLGALLVVLTAGRALAQPAPPPAPPAPPAPPPPTAPPAAPPPAAAPPAEAPVAPAPPPPAPPAPAPPAATAPPPGAAPVAVPPPGPPPPSDHDAGVLHDANAGRNWLAPTALFDPAGTWSFTDFELLIVGASYAPTDWLSLSAATLIPVANDQPFVGLFSIKAQLLKVGRLRLAAQLAATLVADTSSSVDDEGFTASVLGGAATYCLDAGCNSHLTGYLAAGLAHNDQSAVPFLVSGAGVFKVGKRVKLVFEADSAFIAGDINEVADGFLAWYGVRFASASIGVDVGMMKPIAPNDDWDDDAFPAGFPFVSLSYRGLDE